MDWLDRAHTPARKLDLTTVVQSLTALERAFDAVAAARRDVLENFGSDGNPVARTQLRNLQDKATKALAEARLTIAAQFDALRQDAAAMRADARRDFGQSSDGNTYRQALIAYGQLAATMTPDMLAQRITDATDAGLIADARAWSDLARSKFPNAGDDAAGNSRSALYLALHQAADEARTPAEKLADDSLLTVDVAARRFSIFSGTIGDRLDAVLNGSTSTPYDGDFAASNVIPGATSEGGE